jgi:hypothetical protein
MPDTLTEDEFIAISHLDEYPVRETDEVKEIVDDFISAVVARNTSKGNVPEITGTELFFELKLNNGFAVRDQDTGNETIPNSSVLPFYRYNVVHPDTGVVGSIIASGDKRLGNVIAYIENETDDEIVTPFMQMLTANLEDYTTMIIDKYNSITTADIERTVKKYKIQKTGIAATGQVNKNITYITTTGFKPLTRNIKWDQEDGYWEVVNAVHDTEQHLVGCVAVAMGQIMAFHKWPGVCSLTGGGFPNPFKPAENVGFYLYGYDWPAMTETASAKDLTSINGKLGVNILLYEAGVKVNMTYGPRPDGSGAYMGDIPAALDGMAYDVSESAVRPYNIDTIITSINRQQPVILGVDALKITWIIDNYNIVYSEEPVYNSTEPFFRTGYYVHCNLGWGGWKDGWYRSEIFDTNRAKIEDTMKNIVPGTDPAKSTIQGNNSYFRYDMEIIPFLKPDYD